MDTRVILSEGLCGFVSGDICCGRKTRDAIAPNDLSHAMTLILKAKVAEGKRKKRVENPEFQLLTDLEPRLTCRGICPAICSNRNPPFIKIDTRRGEAVGLVSRLPPCGGGCSLSMRVAG